MKRREDPEVSAWLAKAQADLKMSQLAADADTPMWDQACHDLVFLLDRLKSHSPAIEDLADAAAVLTQHGVAPRYPGYLVSETEDDARAAVAHARAIQAFVHGEFAS